MFSRTGGLKSLRDSSENGVMSGVSAASRLSAAMQSMNPSTQLATTQSQHHVEQHQQQHQSADGSSSSMAAARYLLLMLILHLAGCPVAWCICCPSPKLW